jgi:hypothetical protein
VRHANSVCSCLSAIFQRLAHSKPSQSRHLCNKYALPQAIYSLCILASCANGGCYGGRSTV